MKNKYVVKKKVFKPLNSDYKNSIKVFVSHSFKIQSWHDTNQKLKCRILKFIFLPTDISVCYWEAQLRAISPIIADCGNFLQNWGLIAIFYDILWPQNGAVHKMAVSRA